MFLEERERQFNDGHDSRFDFIREFARYNIGEYPVFYFERMGVILMSKEWTRHPSIFFDKDYQFKYLVADYGFFEFEFLSHVFGIPAIRTWELGLSNYLKLSLKRKEKIFKGVKRVVQFNDIDLALRMNG